jgi:hypothetical protein
MLVMLHSLLVLISLQNDDGKARFHQAHAGQHTSSEPEVKQSLKKATCAFYCIQSCHCLSSYYTLLPLHVQIAILGYSGLDVQSRRRQCSQFFLSDVCQEANILML